MRRDLYRGLLEGVASAVAWGLAKQIDQVERHSRSRQRAHAMQIWEGEGGSATDRPTPRALRSPVFE
ncbi:MAG TPA: hypothetical protein VLV16_14935 [Gemmatimonadales bacterium]|nr:hypothetical protein [Gemmatimonadales bacterium]